MGTQYNLGLKNDSLIVFMDIIGFSTLVEKNKNVTMHTKGSLVNYVSIVEHIFDRYSEDYQKEKNIKFLFGSDSIFISTSIDNFECLIDEIKFICNLLFVCSLSFRGGIAIGPLHFERNVWGPAAVEAVKLEKIANNPCIIIKKCIVNKLVKANVVKYFKPIYFELNDCCKDEYMYFDFFSAEFDTLKDVSLLPSAANVYMKAIKENYDESSTNHHKMKWRFLANELINAIQDRSNIIDEIYSKNRSPLNNDSSYYINILKSINEEAPKNG